MNSDSEALASELGTLNSIPKSRSPARINWRLGAILGVSTMLACCGAASLACWVWTLPAPEIPVIDLEGADPEMAKPILAARDDVERSPRSAKAWGKLAMVLHAHSVDGAADACYTTAGNLDRKNPKWPYLQGYLHHDSTGGPERALPLFERAASLSPPNSLARLRLADTLVELGRLDDAYQEYVTVLAADPEEANALLGLGTVAAARGQDRDALRFLLPIAENPRVQKRACPLLADIYERLGERAAAERERQRLAALPEDTPRSDDIVNEVGSFQVSVDIQLEKAFRLQSQQNREEMFLVLRDVVARHPNSDTAWHVLGIELQRSNDFGGAERALQKSIALAPRSPQYRSSLGMLQLSQRQFREAEATFRLALELRPTFGQAHYGLGESLLGQGDPAGAADAYRAALRYSPDFEPARQSLEKLDENR